MRKFFIFSGFLFGFRSLGTKNEYSLEKYLEASFLGAGRGLMGLPIEHPFDCIKTKLQANLSETSAIGVARNIYKNEGIRGYYSGALPNATRLTIKQFYRWPMMLAFPNFFDSVLPLESEHKPIAKKVMTGLSIASFETLIICPLERLKVLLMTSLKEEKSIRHFYEKNNGKITSELYRGLNASYPRQVVSWVTFLASDSKFRSMAQNYKGSENLSFLDLLCVSSVVGVTNTLFTQPFDCAKTQLQKASPLEGLNLLNAFKSIYSKNGVSGLYAGWQVRMMQYIIQSGFTVTILDKLEKKW